MIITLIVSFLLLLLGYWILKYKISDKYLNNYKGPTPTPIFGNVLLFRNLEEILPTVLKLHGEYGAVYKFFVGFNHFLIVADTKFLEYMLTSTKLLEKSHQYDFLYNWLGDGLLTSSGEKWKKHRKILTPAFHFQILEKFTEVFEHYSNILVAKLKQEVNKNNFDIYPYITLCSLDIICATSMGTSINAQEDLNSKYVANVREMCRIILARTTNVLKLNDKFYSFSKDYKKEKMATKFLHDHTFSVIKSRTKQLEGINQNTTDETADEIKKKKSLLDLLIDYKNQFGSVTDEHIREEVDTFMFEGHDTISTTTSFTLYSIATHPQVQKKIVEELCYVFENDMDRAATYKDLQEMKYLEKVIKETLRLYPPVPVFARQVTEHVEYDGGIIPKGTTLAVDVYSIHRDSQIYPEPELFDPERFNFENQSQRSPYAFLPFSAGHRNCIGQKFGMLEVKAIVAKILKKYELLPIIPAQKIVLIPELVLKSRDGIRLQLRERKF